MYKGRLDGAVCEYTEADKMAYLQEVSQKVALLPGVESELSGTSCCLRECRTWRWRRWCSPPWPTWQASGPLLSASLFLTGWKATRWTLQCIVWFVFCWFFYSCSFKFIYDSWLCTKLVPTNQVTTPKEELIAWQSRPMEIVARWLSNNSLSSCILNFDHPIFQVYLVWTRFLCIIVQTIAPIFECTL